MSAIESRNIRLYDENCNGLTLLEMMLALTLSTLLSLALTKLYLSMNRVRSMQHTLISQSQHASKIFAMLREETALAGHIGCARLSSEFIVTPFQSYRLNAENFLIASDGKITFRYQSYPGATLLKDMQNSSFMVTDSFVRYKTGQLLMISDCTQAEIFRAGRVVDKNGVQLIYPSIPLHHQFHKDAEIGLYVSHQYFLRSHVLMRREVDNTNAALIDRIEDLQFQQDSKGLHFSFYTTDKDSRQLWHGYAVINNRA